MVSLFGLIGMFSTAAFAEVPAIGYVFSVDVRSPDRIDVRFGEGPPPYDVARKLVVFSAAGRYDVRYERNGEDCVESGGSNQSCMTFGIYTVIGTRKPVIGETLVAAQVEKVPTDFSPIAPPSGREVDGSALDPSFFQMSIPEAPPRNTGGRFRYGWKKSQGGELSFLSEYREGIPGPIVVYRPDQEIKVDRTKCRSFSFEEFRSIRCPDFAELRRGGRLIAVSETDGYGAPGFRFHARLKWAGAVAYLITVERKRHSMLGILIEREGRWMLHASPCGDVNRC